MRIMMMPDEIVFFKKELKPEFSMLEFGCGGSTVEFSKYVKKYYSIEHDRKFYGIVKQEVLRQNLTNVEMFLIEPDFLHRGMEPAKPGQFIKYSNGADNIGEMFDIILIDGRDRQNCAINSLKYLKPNGTLYFHDFTEGRMSRYGGILNHCDLIEKIDLLAKLKPKIKTT